MKNVLLLAHDDAGQEARFQAALDATRALDGHLHCLDIALLPPFSDDPLEAGTQALLLQRERARESRNKDRLTARLQHEDIPWSWSDVVGSVGPCLAAAAKLSDLIVVTGNLDEVIFPTSGAISRLIVNARRPIMAVPGNVRRLPVDGHVLIAWDGSFGAASALRAAVPLLRFARRVTLFEIDDGSIGTPAADAAAYLARYDIHARTARDFVIADPVADVLLFTVDSEKADYVVMGAYGSHHRLTEALFGGVTRAMLAACPVPLFLAH